MRASDKLGLIEPSFWKLMACKPKFEPSLGSTQPYENWIRNGRSRGWATAQPLNLPFLFEFLFFLQNSRPYMLGHLSLSVNYKLYSYSTIFATFNFLINVQCLKRTYREAQRLQSWRNTLISELAEQFYAPVFMEVSICVGHNFSKQFIFTGSESSHSITVI